MFVCVGQKLQQRPELCHDQFMVAGVQRLRVHSERGSNELLIPRLVARNQFLDLTKLLLYRSPLSDIVKQLDVAPIARIISTVRPSGLSVWMVQSMNGTQKNRSNRSALLHSCEHTSMATIHN